MKSANSAVNLPEMERNVLKYWKKADSFRKSLENRRSRKEYSFYDGPPFANGLPHYGHLLANTVKDIVPRFWTMKGYFVDRRFGWDCHGLPVEYEVEKSLGLKGRKDILKLGVKTFNQHCRESVLFYAEKWQETITRLGRWVDWDNQYRTMDKSFMESVWWVFSELYKKDFVYQGHKVVPYSPRITAVLSNFEANQNYKDVQDPALTVKFKLKDEDLFMLAWTTTPWTLISNQALAIHPKEPYVKFRDIKSNEYYIVAKERLKDLYPKKGKEEHFDSVTTIEPSTLIGRRYEPLFPYYANRTDSFVVLPGEHVSMDDGTGIVHTAPCYGEEDFNICQKAGIAFVDSLDEEGCFLSSIKEYAGQFVKDADKDIIKALKDRGLIFKHDTIVHSYPFCDRTDTPLIYRAIPAWYVSVEKIKGELVENNQKIRWVPEHLRDGRMGKWLENARDWAIGRNRFWGTPLPIWTCEKDSTHRVCLGSAAELEKLSGKKVDDLHKDFIDEITFACEKCQAKMKRIPEVFDCWFESGSMPYAQLHYPFENKERFQAAFPADFIAEGLDQTRGWFYTLSVLSTALFDKPAFKNVIVNGLVLAEDGRKMSKRWKNYTPPDELMDELGADSVRLYMIGSAILRGEDLRFANNGVKDTTRAVLLPLWNAYSFLTTYAEADKWDPHEQLISGPPSNLKSKLDRWIVSRFYSTVRDIDAQMQEYQLYNVPPILVGFIEDLTNWYIRLNRRRFWGGEGTMTEDTRQAYETLYSVLVGFCKALAPFAPYMSEAIFQGLTAEIGIDKDSVHVSDFPAVSATLIDSDLEREMSLIRNVTELGRSLRAKHQIRTRQVLSEILIITSNPEDRRSIEESMDLLKQELNVKKVGFTSEETKYVNFSAKPNLKTLGKKLGKELGNFRTALEAVNAVPEKVAKIINQVEAKGSAQLGEFQIEKDDLLIERLPKGEQLIATAMGVTVLLDTKLTEDLILEGLAREIVNRVQKLRKDSGLNVTDRINLVLAGSADIEKAFKTHQTYIQNEVLASKATLEAIKATPGAFRESFNVDGNDVTIGINKT
ncbi:MAG: isoleucine--tRNA ligase [Oligoflexales bacterium]